MLVSKPLPLGSTMHTREDSIKMDLDKEMWCVGVAWIQLPLAKVQWGALVNMVIKL
jgi:hypothetical protein